MQGNKPYIGNHNHAVTSKEVTGLFSNYGQVESVNIIPGDIKSDQPVNSEKIKKMTAQDLDKLKRAALV